MGCERTGVTIKCENLKKGTKIADFELKLTVVKKITKMALRWSN